jgi:hypothetical protein
VHLQNNGGRAAYGTQRILAPLLAPKERLTREEEDAHFSIIKKQLNNSFLFRNDDQTQPKDEFFFTAYAENGSDIIEQFKLHDFLYLMGALIYR